MVNAPFGVSQKIVIVEDNQALSDIYKTRLELLGYTVIAAYDGMQALSVIEREKPNLVLLDLMVPKIAGDQVLERMRGSEWGKNIKVLIISNLNEADAPKGLRNLGIEGYAVKANLNNDQLDQLVDTILKPAGQVEDVVLAHPGPPQVTHSGPSSPPPDSSTADPYSGTRLQSSGPVTDTQPNVTPAAEPKLPVVAEAAADKPMTGVAELAYEEPTTSEKPPEAPLWPESTEKSDAAQSDQPPPSPADQAL